MNEQLLDIVARGIMQLVGLDPESIRQERGATSRRQANQQRPQVEGQRSALKSTLDPVSSRSQLRATPPARPPGGFGQAPGQLDMFQPPAQPPANRMLPAAGESGGSKPPKGTSAPQRGGPAPSPEQRSRMRRADVASRKAAGNIRSSTGSAVRIGQPAKQSLLSKALGKYNHPVIQGILMADAMLQATGAGGLIDETFGTGATMERFKELSKPTKAKKATQKPQAAPAPQPTQPEQPTYIAPKAPYALPSPNRGAVTSDPNQRRLPNIRRNPWYDR